MGLKNGLFFIALLSFAGAQESGWANPWFKNPPETSSAFPYVQVDVTNNELKISEFISVDRNITAIICYTGSITPTLLTPSSKFDLVQSSVAGELNLILKVNVDYEQRANLDALIFQIIGVTGYNTLTVNVIDENDNTPFIRDFQSNIVFEEGKLGTIQTFRATDADSGDQGRLLYSLKVLSGSADYFQLNSVNESGRIVANLDLAKPLDYEMETFYLFEITVKDRETGGLNSSIQFNLRVQDVGDEPPRWKSQSPVVRIPEEQPPGSFVLRVVAEDGDFGVRNTISYILEDGFGYFQINSQTGEVTLERSIDRESLLDGFFELRIIAFEVQDPSSRSNTTSSVFIDDINDCSPVFSNPSYFVNISEAYLGRLPLEDISVFDPDLGNSGSYTLRFQGDSSIISKLSMTPANGIGRQNTTYYISISSGLLDYDNVNQRSVTFTLEATELVDSLHKSQATVTIQSYDVNDNPPEFVNAPPGGYVVSLPENVAKGAPVIQVEVADADILPEYGKPSIRFSLQQPDGQTLAINQETGEITVAIDNAFDREKLAMLTYTIQITDNFGNGARSSMNLNLTVTDINDTPPRFQTFSLDVAVEENSESGTSVLDTIVAEDLDLDPNLQFSINWAKSVFTKNRVPVIPTPANHLKEYFAIQGTRLFRATAAAKLIIGSFPPDREVADAADIYIVVNDTNTAASYASSDEVKISITILDVNDNDPRFDNSTWYLAINENADVGSFIGSVRAVDIDLDNTITYAIEECSQGDGFIDIESSTGRITVKEMIDRETTPMVVCTLKATDSGTPSRSSTSTVEVKILDQNDCDPVIVEKPPIPVVIPENSPSNLKIGKVRATDEDEGPFGNVSYLFSAFNTEGADHFSVDLNSGDIFVFLRNNQTLDFETKSRYTFKVEARDNYNPNFIAGSRSSYADIVVQLTDENDNAPELPTPNPFSCFAQTVELTPKDGLVATFSAIDKDEPNTERSSIFYTLVGTQSMPGTPPTTDQLFRMETIDNQGYLRVNLENLSNKFGNYSVTVMAKDQGSPPLNTTKSYKICVLDSNDNSPIFTFPDKDNLRVEIYENQTIGGRLLYITNNGLEPLVVKADDKDEDLNGLVSYSLGGDPAGTFFLDPADGFFVLNSKLDRLNISQYTLTITAKDAGDPVRSVSRNMIIYIRGISKYLPEFPSQTQTLNFTENLLQDNNFTAASDKDNVNTAPEDQEQICYFLVGGSAGFRDYFRIPDPSVNTLSLVKPLDRESIYDQQLYALIEASNQCIGKPPDTDQISKSRVNITLNIQDVLDEPPYFTRNYSGGVSTGDKKDLPVLTFSAEDPDIGDVLLYSHNNDFSGTDPSINILNPFRVKSESREIILNFDVQNNMKGLFRFSIKAVDKMNMTGTTNVRIYIVTQDNKVTFSFENTYEQVQRNRDQIADIFTDVYEYTCNIERIEQDQEASKAAGSNITIVYSHFINSQTDMPVPSSEIKKDDYNLNQELKGRFEKFNLTLTGVKSVSDVTDPQQQLFFILFIVVCIALVPLIALLFMMVIRGNQMNRKIKALSATTFGSQDSGLNRLGASVPNTNKHTLEGSNPMWNVDSSSPRQDADNISESSGDSILIGVEDNPEFRNYNGGGQKNLGFGQERSNPYDNVVRKNPLAETGIKASNGDSWNYSSGKQNKGFEQDFESYLRNPAAEAEDNKPKKRLAPLPPAKDQYDQDDGSDMEGNYEQEINPNFSLGGSNLTSL